MSPTGSERSERATKPQDSKTNEVMEILSALEPRHPVVCPERKLFDMQVGTWFVETIRASGHVRRVIRPDTRPHLAEHQSHQKSLAKQEPSTQDKPAIRPRRRYRALPPIAIRNLRVWLKPPALVARGYSLLICM